MPPTQVSRDISTKSCRTVLALCVGVALVWLAAARADAAASQVGVAAPPAGTASVTQDLPATTQQEGEYFTPDMGAVFRVRHIEGRGQGDVAAFTNLGFTKFNWTEHGVVMIDIGARITNEGDGGFTGGIHRRTVLGDFMLGGGVFYDIQEFEQGSVAFEMFKGAWAFRANGYYVIDEDVHSEYDYVTTPATNIFFQGNNILADGLDIEEHHEVAMDGFDLELARGIGWRSTEAYVGCYHYNGELGSEATGVKGGMRGFVVPDLAATVSVSNDDLFGTNVFGGITWFVGARGGLSRPIVNRRLTIPVERNEQIVVNEVERVDSVVGPVVLTYDDDAIEIVHVDSAAVLSLNEGTIDDPFNTLPDTQEADIVYVHADSVFVGQSYTLAEDQRFLGEGDGNLHLVETEELGEIVLPAGNGGVARPVIQDAPALTNAVNLFADDNEVSNFNIVNSLGNGIFGDQITDFDINRNLISGSVGRGIFLNNINGLVDDKLVANGEVTDNDSSNNNLANIELVLASDFDGEVSGNIANDSVAAEGIRINGDGFLFIGEVSDNTASNNATDGIFLTFGVFDGEVDGNTTNGNGDNGIDFNITGDGRSDADITDNTANLNGAEGIHLLFSGTGISIVEVLDNNLSGNNAGIDREFFAENEDAPGNRPEVFIELDDNTSTNVLLVNPPFNYEFDNNDLFADGEMTLEQGTNFGSVEDDEDVEPGELP